MALIECAECGHEVADTAKSCTNCGFNTRSKRLERWKSDLVLLPIALLCGVAAYWLVGSPLGFFVGPVVVLALFYGGWELMGKRNITDRPVWETAFASIECAECGHEVSDTATRCPKCGYNTGSKRLVRWKILVVLMPLMILGGLVPLWLLDPPLAYVVSVVVAFAVYNIGFELMGKRNIPYQS